MKSALILFTLVLFGLGTAHSQGQKNFTIIEDITKSNHKRALIIRLKHKVTKEELAKIARQIKSTNKIKHKRTFITHYLPGMKTGTGAWATTHFNPTLEVKILGLSLQDEKKLKKEKPNNAIGSWIANSGLPGIITIFKKQESYILEWKYADGSKTLEPLVKKSSPKGTRFNQKNKPSGDYFIITKKGNLEIWDKLGLIFSYRSQ